MRKIGAIRGFYSKHTFASHSAARAGSLADRVAHRTTDPRAVNIASGEQGDILVKRTRPPEQWKCPIAPPLSPPSRARSCLPGSAVTWNFAEIIRNWHRCSTTITHDPGSARRSAWHETVCNMITATRGCFSRYLPVRARRRQHTLRQMPTTRLPARSLAARAAESHPWLFTSRASSIKG